MTEDQFAHFDVEVPDHDDGERFPIESETAHSVDNRGWFVVDGNDVICRTHFIVFLFVGLLCGAAIGTLLAIVTS